jgi:tagatose 6-phosphate kinase
MTGIVSLNLTIDRLYSVEDFSAGNVYRASAPVIQAGGKGVNVAAVLKQLNEPCTLTGCIGGTAGQHIEQDLLQRNISLVPLRISAESRTCIIVDDAYARRQTVINESGGIVTSDEKRHIAKQLHTFVRDHETVVFSGSVPPGVSAVDFSRFIARAAQQHKRVIVDASGHCLATAVQCAPYAVKPNLKEWSEACGAKKLSLPHLRRTIMPIVKKGTSWFIVTMGKGGALFFTDKAVWRAHVPRIAAVNTVGCGDAFTAALARSVNRK